MAERPNESSAAQDRIGWLAGWRAALAAWVMPRGFALWTYGVYGDEGYDELVVAKPFEDDDGSPSAGDLAAKAEDDRIEAARLR